MSSYAVFEALGIYKASALAGKRKDKTQSFPESDNIKINLPTTYQKGNVPANYFHTNTHFNTPPKITKKHELNRIQML